MTTVAVWTSKSTTTFCGVFLFGGTPRSSLRLEQPGVRRFHLLVVPSSVRERLAQTVKVLFDPNLRCLPRRVDGTEGRRGWATPTGGQSVEVRVQRLNLTVEALDGCSGLGGGEQNLLAINVVSGHAWRIRSLRARSSPEPQVVENSGTSLAGDKRQRDLDGRPTSRGVHHRDGAAVSLHDGVDNR